MASLNGGLASQVKTYNGQSQKAFLTTQAFNTRLFTYATSMNSNFVTVGTLTANTSATATNCPANRVLHTNGRQLIPGVNPGIVKPLLGVYDPITSLNGFIDPTDPTFAVYDVNMPFQFDLGISSPIATLGGQGANTRIGLDSGRLAQTAENGTVNAGDASIGEFAFFTTTTARTSTVTIQSSQVTPTSRIFLTPTSFYATTTAFSTLQTGLPVTPSVSTITTGSFQVVLPAPLFQNDLKSYNFVVL